MSQDTGLFSVRRPREACTIGGANYNSSLPQPASTLKRSNSISGINATHTAGYVRSLSSSRQSLAPQRPSQPQFQRATSGTNLQDLGLSSVKRTSFQNSSGRKSYAPAQVGRPSDEITERRSSVYRSRLSTNGSVGHQSFFQQAPQPAGVPRDPRPLRDRSYQAKIGQELLDYMAANNFEMEMKYQLTQNSIKSPTAKDFSYMFQWLYHRIDPSYRFQKSIDQEVPPILIQLRYPMQKSITKSSLAAVGSANSWHIFLGLLHWMMQLAQMLDGYGDNKYDDACTEAGVDVSGDRIIFDFLSRAYRDWLSMDEDANDDDQDQVLAPHIEAMAKNFENSNLRNLEELRALESENQRLRKELQALEKSESDAATLDRNYKIMEEDKVKFEEFDTRMNQKSEKYETRIQFLQDEIEKLALEWKEIDEERANLQKALIGLIPAAATNKKENKYELQVVVNEGPNFSSSQMGQSTSMGIENDRLLVDGVVGYQPAHILNLDLRGQVKSSFVDLRKEISERRSVAMDEVVRQHDLLDGLKESLEDKRGEVEALEHRVRSAEEEYEKTREVSTTQKLASDAQIERMEKELAKMRSGLTESVQLMEQREMNSNIEYEQLILSANALREKLHTDIEKMLNDIIKFKVHIQKNLEDLEEFVVDEVEHELAVDEDDKEPSVDLE
ncbi:BgTH12-00027 [Blumeria graminis f. sp. triticale]|uniref:Kinetochore protein NDC80 n=1 Tax=Blumeria graminis f. sp. triticale TaxID=1689686 RepID=A0A9W4GGE6_BLUGR|nr:BgTH12-00027 [Blumeria graminis f. sp. triticale]